MSSLPRVSPSVHADRPRSNLKVVEPVTEADRKRASYFGLRLPAPDPSPCPCRRRWGRACYQLYPNIDDMPGWCDSCRDGSEPDDGLPDWMRGADSDAPAEPQLPMPDWIQVKAQELRLLGSDLAEWLADKVDELASECRALEATTPAEFEDRREVLTEWAAESDHLTDADLYPLGIC